MPRVRSKPKVRSKSRIRSKPRVRSSHGTNLHPSIIKVSKGVLESHGAGFGSLTPYYIYIILIRTNNRVK